MCFYAGCGFLSDGTSVLGSNIHDIDDREEPKDTETEEEESEISVRSARFSDKMCIENEACQIICQTIYKEDVSHNNCYNRSYGEVDDMQNIFRALIEEDTSHQIELLKSINSHSLKLYLSTGLDGFRDKVVLKIEQYSNKLENYKNILRWMSKNQEIVEVIDEEDMNNEIVITMISNYVQARGLDCAEAPLQACQKDHHRSICGCSSHNISLDDTTGEIIYHLSTASHPVTISSLGPKQKNLLKVLSFVDSEGWNFFLYSAEQHLRQSAFIWAYGLVKDACINEHKTLMNQCMAGFLCWLDGIDSNKSLLTEDSDIQNQITSEVVQSVQNGCRF